jgi:hypothetical protein
MPRPKSLKPKYCRHPSGRAYVRIEGHFTYLGEHGTQASRDAYDRLIGEWIARNRISPVRISEAPDSPTSMTVSTLIAAFWRHAQTYYVDREGKKTPELENFRCALRPLRRLYGATPAAGFDAVALEAIRGAMIRPGVGAIKVKLIVWHEEWIEAVAHDPHQHLFSGFSHPILPCPSRSLLDPQLNPT